MTSAATVSDHHQPSAVSSARLASVTADRAAPARLRMPSARSAALSSADARRSLARARTGSARTEAPVSARPTGERSGARWTASAAIALALDVDPEMVSDCADGVQRRGARCGRRRAVLSVRDGISRRARPSAVPSVIESAPNAKSAIELGREPGDDRADPDDRGPADRQAAPPDRLRDLPVPLRHRRHGGASQRLTAAQQVARPPESGAGSQRVRHGFFQNARSPRPGVRALRR